MAASVEVARVSASAAFFPSFFLFFFLSRKLAGAAGAAADRAQRLQQEPQCRGSVRWLNFPLLPPFPLFFLSFAAVEGEWFQLTTVLVVGVKANGEKVLRAFLPPFFLPFSFFFIGWMISDRERPGVGGGARLGFSPSLSSSLLHSEKATKR